MGSNISNLRQDVKNNTRPVNILIVREQGVGKSALVNTIKFSVTDVRTIVAKMGAKEVNVQSRTTQY